MMNNRFRHKREVTSQCKYANLRQRQADNGNISDFSSSYFIDSGAPSRPTWRTSTRLSRLLLSSIESSTKQRRRRRDLDDRAVVHPSLHFPSVTPFPGPPARGPGLLVRPYGRPRPTDRGPGRVCWSVHIDGQGERRACRTCRSIHMDGQGQPRACRACWSVHMDDQGILRACQASWSVHMDGQGL